MLFCCCVVSSVSKKSTKKVTFYKIAKIIMKMISCLMTVNNIIVYCCITAEKLKHCEFLLTGGPANPAGPGAPISPRSP